MGLDWEKKQAKAFKKGGSSGFRVGIYLTIRADAAVTAVWDPANMRTCKTLYGSDANRPRYCPEHLPEEAALYPHECPKSQKGFDKRLLD